MLSLFWGGITINKVDILGLAPKDKHYGLPPEFWGWYHDEWKLPGDRDATEDEALDAYEAWVDEGMPNKKGGNRPPAPEAGADPIPLPQAPATPLPLPSCPPSTPPTIPTSAPPPWLIPLLIGGAAIGGFLLLGPLGGVGGAVLVLAAS